MRIVCLEQNTENSFLSKLKKMEVSSYRLLTVLHMGCIYKSQATKTEIRESSRRIDKRSQLSSSFFVVKSISCSITLLTKTNRDMPHHPMPFLLYSQQFTGIPSLDYLIAGKVWMHHYHSCCHMRYITWSLRQNILSWIQKWIICPFCERSDKLKQKYSSRLMHHPGWLQFRINHSLRSLWICIPTGESFYDHVNS